MLNQIDMNRVYYFVKIVEAGNITKAAELLNEPKAKVSRNLILLEEELGVQLVYRTTRQFKLTDSGAQFFEQARENIEGLIESVSLLKNQDDQFSGKIKITAPDDLGTYVITKIVDEFSKLHPKIEFELLYTNEMIDLVKQGFDIGIRIGQLKDSSLIQKRPANIEFILVSSPRYLKRITPISDINDLKSLQTIGFLNREWLLYNKMRQAKLKLKHSKSSNNFIALRDLTISGHGVACLPRFICEEHLKSGELVHVLKQWGDRGPYVQVVIPQQKNVPKKVRAFFEYSAKRIGEIFN